MKVRINSQNNSISNNLIRRRIQTISQENGLSKEVQTVLVNLFDYMMNKQMYGCCHAFSSVLYVALCELGEKPQLYVGECYNFKEKPFDHSWIVLNSKVIDIAIYMPLTQKCNSITGVVIMDIDTATQMKHNTQYGYKTGLGLEDTTKEVLKTPFVEYMNKCPFEHNGLWTVVRRILHGIIEFDIDNAKAKYSDTERTFVCKEDE